MTAILLVGFGLTVTGIGAILIAVYLAWRQLARELDDVRQREKARERVYQLMTKDDPEPADEPPSMKRRGHLRVIKVVTPIMLLLVWLRDQRQAAALAAGGLAITAVAASGPLPPPQPPPISTPSPQSVVAPPPPTSVPASTLAPPTMPPPVNSPEETGVLPPAPRTTSAPRESSTVILSATLMPSLPHSVPPPLPPDTDNDCTVQVLELCVPPVT